MARTEGSRGVYLPRRAEEPPLYGVVSGHLETFLHRVRERGRTVPRFVERGFRGFLVQRLGDALNLNLHFHTLVLDGVFDAGADMRFRPLPPPDDAEVARVARPPLATERLEPLPDGRLLYHLRHRWRDGTTHVPFEPLELLERLAALVPPPRFNLVRYHGVLAPAATQRARVIPGGGTTSQRALAASRHNGCAPLHARPPVSGSTALPETDRDPRSAGPGLRTLRTRPGCQQSGPPEHSVPAADSHLPRPRRYEWAELMRRVFAVDVLECPRCQGRMRILAAIHPPENSVAILECLDLPSRAPPAAEARLDPEPEPDLPDF